LIYMTNHPHCVAVGTGVRLIAPDGSFTRSSPSSREGSVIRGLRWRNVVSHPSAMIRRTALEQVGGYSLAANRAEDYDLWLRLAAVGEVHNIRETLLRYRIHSSQVTRTNRIPEESKVRIGESRYALARARGESVFAARMRQGFFRLRTRLRSQ
jgi:hypothetical protein